MKKHNVKDILEAVVEIRGTEIPDLKHALDVRFNDNGDIFFMSYWTNSFGASVMFEAVTGLKMKESTTGYVTIIGEKSPLT